MKDSVGKTQWYETEKTMRNEHDLEILSSLSLTFQRPQRQVPLACHTICTYFKGKSLITPD